jgi:cytochrome b pre-mRNA-processing protein 3
MILDRFFKSSPQRAAARRLYEAVVAQSREPRFYTLSGVPDTATGRFDLIALHGFLVMHRLKGADDGADLARAFSETLVEDIDRNLREMGTGDLSVGRKVKQLTQGFYGRMEAYEEGLAAGDPVLQSALQRNLFGGEAAAGVSEMAVYLRREARHLADQPMESLAAGIVSFGSPPGVPATADVAGGGQ